MSIQLYQGDCLELMKDIPDGSVDMVLTSPPYDNLRTYNGNIEQWNFEKFKLLSAKLFRVTKTGGVVVWIVNDATIDGSETGTSFRQALYFKEIGFNLHDTMIWKKISVYQHKNRYIPSFEYMFVFSKGRPKTTNIICDRKNKSGGRLITGSERRSDGSLKKMPGAKERRRIKEFGQRLNVWEITDTRGNKIGHPATFPVQLAKDHILTWSNKGDVVLDPLMGSGTTGVACVNTGRNFIGIELDPGYFETAKRRIAEAEAAL